MSIIHGLWSSRDTLQVWGERPLDSDRLPRPRGRAPADGSPRRHPYALRADEVMEMLDDMLGHAVPFAASSGEAAAILPSGRTSPLPSPGLPGASAVAPDIHDHVAWRVDAVELSGVTLLDTLLSLPTEPRPAGRPDAALTTLGHLAWLALDLVVRGRVLPSLTVRGGRYQARWQPVLDPTLARQLTEVAASLPASLLAIVGGNARSPGTVVREAIEQLTDAAARTALESMQLLPPHRGRRKPTVEEAWLAALTRDDPHLAGDPNELASLAKDLDVWRHSAGESGGPLRTAFRLVPPHDEAPDNHTWEVEFLLQAADDPSLQVPSADVWKAGRTLTFLERTLEHPQERLLTDLGHATRLWPQLEAGLATATPTGVKLDVDGVVAFLRDTAPLLQQAGYGVLLPVELRRPARLGARLKTTSNSSPSATTSTGLLGLEGIVAYEWQVAVGDQPVTATELSELARLKSPLVRFRGRWVALEPDDLRSALLLLEQPAATMTTVEAARIGIGALDPEIGLPVAGIDADGALATLLSPDADATLEPLDTPEGFTATLRPYQARGLAWLAYLTGLGLGGCLADDMGMGKTLQLLALLVHERTGRSRRSRAWPPPTLLVCPMSIVGNWEREAARFAPGLRVHVHHGSDRLDGDALARAARRADLMVTTYATATRDRDALAGIQWGRLTLDEAQHIKNPQSKQSRALRSLPAQQRLALTGTPVENRLAELWSIMDFCNPGLLGTQSAFRRRFALPIERLQDDEAAASLRRVTRPFMLRRVKTDRAIIPDLPDKIEYDDACNLTREQASLYQAVVDDMLARIENSDGIQRKGLVLTTMLRLKQVCNHPAHLLADGSSLPDRSGKLDRLDEVVDELLASNERALIFTQFAEWGTHLQRHLRDRTGHDVAFIHGGVSKAARDRMVTAFQSDGGPPLFVLSLKAAGVGLNLTAANHVIHYDRWWNPAVEDQATDRAFRIGQRKDVVVRRLVCVGTLEERIGELIRRKRELADRVVGTGESWLTELSTKELRDVFALGADAVAE